MSSAFRSAKPKERLEAAREYVACLERTATTLREAIETTRKNSSDLQEQLSETKTENTKLEGDLAYVKRRLVDAEQMLIVKEASIAELEGEAERQRQRAEDALLGSIPATELPKATKAPPIDIGRSQHNKTPVPAGKWNAPRGTY